MSTILSPESPSAATPSDAEKRSALKRALAAASFDRAEQLRALLRYVCEMEIAGRGGELSEYLIGIEALGKPPGYSTGEDASVRKRAHDLRQRLEDLYLGELSGDEVRIEIPKGRYAPRFVYRSAPPAVVLPPALDTPRPTDRPPAGGRTRILVKVFWFGFVVGVLAILAGYFVWTQLHPQRQIVDDPGQVFEAEARANALTGKAGMGPCPACSGRARVKWIGNGGAITFPVDVSADGDYMLQIDYLVEGPRTFLVSINDGPAIEVPVRGNHWWIPASTAIMARLRAGRNTVHFFNPGSYAPDLDRLVVR